MVAISVHFLSQVHRNQSVPLSLVEEMVHMEVVCIALGTVSDKAKHPPPWKLLKFPCETLELSVLRPAIAPRNSWRGMVAPWSATALPPSLAHLDPKLSILNV